MCVGCNVAGGGKQAPDCRPVASRGPPEERHRDDEDEEDEEKDEDVEDDSDDEDDGEDDDDEDDDDEDVCGVAGNKNGYQR